MCLCAKLTLYVIITMHKNIMRIDNYATERYAKFMYVKRYYAKEIGAISYFHLISKFKKLNLKV
jgi:hypothetical protein